MVKSFFMMEIRERYRNKSMGKPESLNLSKLINSPENYLICGKAAKPKLVLKDYMSMLLKE